MSASTVTAEYRTTGSGVAIPSTAPAAVLGTPDPCEVAA